MIEIKTTILSIASTALLLAVMCLGASVSIYDVRLSCEVSADGIDICITPTFLCDMDTRDLFHGMCYGNVMVLNHLPSEMHRTEMIAHEARHLDHWQALGLWGVWLGKRVLPLEPRHRDVNDPSVGLAQMWAPPPWWPYHWSFITFTLKL